MTPLVFRKTRFQNRAFGGSAIALEHNGVAQISSISAEESLFGVALYNRNRASILARSSSITKYDDYSCITIFDHYRFNDLQPIESFK